MSVSSGLILDKLAEACTRWRQEGERGASWVWMWMSAEERVAFDLFLVKMGDELAYEAGTPEGRFSKRVRRMVEAIP